MKKLDKVVVAGIQESVTNATSLAGAIASALYDGSSLVEDIGAACMVLFDYIERTADIVGSLMEEEVV